LLLAIALAIAACSGDSGVQLPELTAFDSALAEQVETIQAQTAYIRGLEVPEGLEQGTLARERLTEYSELAAAEAREESEEEIASFNTAFRLLHMMGPEDDLLDIFTSYQSNLVLGFYSIDDEKLVLVADAPRQLALEERSTISHESVHAMQDAAFDLEELQGLADEEEEDKANTEYADTIDALIEGDANFAEAKFETIAPPDGTPVEPPAALSDAEEAALAEIPPAIRRYLGFPYAFGENFVTDLFEDGGWTEVNNAFEDPPVSEEQIMHPEKYREGELPHELELPEISDALGEGWKQQADSVFGEYDTYNWLTTTLEDDQAAIPAAIGWGGGRMAAYARPDDGSVLLHMALSWDSNLDALEFFSVFAVYVQMLDAEPTIVDPESFQVVAWEAPDEAGRAWIDGTNFEMMVAVSPDDLAAALQAVDAPEKISHSGYLVP
jgi:hypothetical protein